MHRVGGARLIIRSVTTAMTNANVFLRSASYTRSCKVEQRKWENIAECRADESGIIVRQT